MVLDVALPRLPVRAARSVEEDDRHRARLSRLDERQRLEPFVVRAEPAGEQHDGVRLLDEGELPREEALERGGRADARRANSGHGERGGDAGGGRTAAAFAGPPIRRHLTLPALGVAATP